MVGSKWPERASKRRLMVLWLGTVLAVLILTGRLFYWQVIRHKELRNIGERWQLLDRPIPALRGKIMDQHGFMLATDEYEFEIFASPMDIDAPDILATELAPILGRDQGVLAKLLSQKGGTYVPLARRVPLEKARRVEKIRNDLNQTALGISAAAKRGYPGKQMACHLLGFVTRDREVFYGVEEFYDDELRGIEGSWGGASDVLDFNVGLGPAKVILPQDGRDVILTVDCRIQQIAEEELLKAISEFRAEGGTIIVMGPRTGAVLAMTSYPSYDPNLYFGEAIREEVFTNPAISTPYEPGSVFKVITMASALDSGMYGRDSTYNDVGQILVGGNLIRNWDRRAYGVRTMTELLGYSLNVGAATLSTELGSERFYSYLRRFGFGEVTGIDLPHEAAGTLRLPGDADWHDADLGTNAFGQGIAVTPIQMITAIAAVANDGVLPTPYIVQRIELEGETIEEFHPRPGRRVISSLVARELTEMLVESLEGKENLSIPGYAIAGKTGTAQIPITGGYDPEGTVGAFVGYAPARDPQFIVLVKIDRPKESPWGTVVAVPAFRQIAQKLFIYMGIPPDQVRMASR